MRPTMRESTIYALYGWSLCLTLFQHGSAGLLTSGTVPLLPTGETNCGDLGTFSNGTPWTSIDRPVPPPNCNFSIKFWLCRSGSEPLLLSTNPTLDLEGTGVDTDQKFVFIIHGFTDYVLFWWPQYLAELINEKYGYNVIAVDWSKGAKGPDYLQATSNTRVVGAATARVVDCLVGNYSVSKLNITVIGHSLGAQTASYASNGVGGLGKILGLDPAQPLFEGLNPIVRLDKSDACAVVVIHTNGAPFALLYGFGYMAPCGDWDFYPNGGANQPGCPDLEPVINPFTFADLNSSVVFKASIACSHCRSYELLRNMVLYDNCTMWGHLMPSCEGLPSLTTPSYSSSCKTDTCSPMGLNAPMFSAEGCFTLSTNGESSFCIPDSQSDMAMKNVILDENQRIKDMCDRKSISY